MVTPVEMISKGISLNLDVCMVHEEVIISGPKEDIQKFWEWLSERDREERQTDGQGATHI